MTQAIALTPERASCYNNRAQIHRFNSNIDLAMADLNKAILLCKGQERSACQAFCQRGKLATLFKGRTVKRQSLGYFPVSNLAHKSS